MKRYVKVFREQGEEGFFQPRPRHRSETKLTNEIRRQGQELLEAGENVAEVGRLKSAAGNTAQSYSERAAGGEKKL